jgi:hypothetical protein
VSKWSSTLFLLLFFIFFNLSSEDINQNFINKMSACYNTISEDHRRIGGNSYDIFSTTGLEETDEIIVPDDNLNYYKKKVLLDAIHIKAISNGIVQYLRYADMSLGSKNFTEISHKELKHFMINVLKYKNIYLLFNEKTLSSMLDESIIKFKKMYKGAKSSDEYIQEELDKKIIPSLIESNRLCKTVKEITETIDVEISCHKLQIDMPNYFYDENGNKVETYKNIDIDKEIYDYSESPLGCEAAEYDNYKVKKSLEKKAYEIFGITISDLIQNNGINDVLKSSFFGEKIGFPLKNDFIYKQCMARDAEGKLFNTNNTITVQDVRRAYIQLSEDVFNFLFEKISEDKKSNKKLDSKISKWLIISPYVVGEATGLVGHIDTSKYICYLISKINKKELRWDVVEGVLIGVTAVAGVASMFMSGGSTFFIYTTIVASTSGIAFGGVKYFRYKEMKKISEQKILSDKSTIGSTSWFLARYNIIKGLMDTERYEMYTDIALVVLFDAAPLVRLLGRTLKVINTGKYFKVFKTLSKNTDKMFDMSKNSRYVKPPDEIISKFPPFKQRIIRSWDFISQMKKCRGRYGAISGNKTRNIFKQPKEIRRRTVRTSLIGATIGAGYSVIGYLTHPPENVDFQTIEEILKKEHKDVWEAVKHDTKDLKNHIGTDLAVGLVMSFVKHVLGISIGNNKFVPTFLFFTSWGWMKTGINNTWYYNTEYPHQEYGDKLDSFMAARVTGEAVFHVANSLAYTGVIRTVLGLGCLYPVSNLIKKGEWFVQFGYRFACSQMFYISRNESVDKLYYDGGYYAVKEEVEEAINWVIKNAPYLKKEDYDNKLKELEETLDTNEDVYFWDDELGDFIEN